MVSRRMFLKTGTAAIVVTGAAGSWWGATRSPERALAPWADATAGYGDPRLDALAYAVLAPNPHNRQPWQVELIGKNAFDVTCDLGRRLPDTDPFDRQITIGLGCFLELFRLAAAVQGFRAAIEAFPDGEPEPRLDNGRVARVTLAPQEPLRDPLFNVILDRRSNKEPYDITRSIPDDLFAALTAEADVGGTVETSRIEVLRDLSWRAHKIEMLTPRTLMESINLMRFGRAQVEANPDGINFSGIKYEFLYKSGIMTPSNMADPNSTVFAQGMDIFHNLLHSAMGHVWVKTAGNSRLDQLAAGKTWVRLNLKATALGLAVHPLSQALQEYQEMADLFGEIHEHLGAKSEERIQMFARVGYGPTVEAKPRWPLLSRLVSA